MAARPNQLAARLPRGLADRGAGDLRASEAMLATIKRVYEAYGFEPVEQPFIEYTEALGKFLPDQDRPNAGVFSFQDDDEQSLAAELGEQRGEASTGARPAWWMLVHADVVALR